MSLVVCPGCSRHAFAHELACPHCGVKGKPTLVALVAALGLVAACSSSESSELVVSVYGPAPVDSEARTVASSATVKVAPPPEVDVYGPAPVDPSARLPEPAPSQSATSAPPGTLPTAKPKPPVKVYGPPPRDPKQRE